MTDIRRDHTIDVPGIPAELQSLARGDIERLSDAIASVADSQECDSY